MYFEVLEVEFLSIHNIKKKNECDYLDIVISKAWILYFGHPLEEQNKAKTSKGDILLDVLQNVFSSIK